MPTLEFTVPGKPVGKSTFSPLGMTAQLVNTNARRYIKTVSDAARSAVLREGWVIPEKQCPVTVVIHAFFPIPKSWPKWKREKVVTWPHFVSPDYDNIAKSVNDALQGSRVAPRTREGIVVIEDSAISGPTWKWWTVEGEGYTQISVTYDEAINREVKSWTRSRAR